MAELQVATGSSTARRCVNDTDVDDIIVISTFSCETSETFFELNWLLVDANRHAATVCIVLHHHVSAV